MFESNNIIAVLMAILPVFLYSYLVFHLIPRSYVSTRRLRMYLVTGMLSPAIVLLFIYIFPGWTTSLGFPSLSLMLLETFIQIGLLEETTKFITFKWVSSQRRNSEYDLPIATMYYCLMTSAAFAIVENIRYLISYGDGVLFIRGLTAILAHMVCGVIMGYFIAKSRKFSKVILTEKIQGLSLFDESAEMKAKINRIKFILYGIFGAAAFHGIYDFNLSLLYNVYSNFTTFIIILAGLIIGHFMIKELIKESKELRDENYFKDIEHNKYK